MICYGFVVISNLTSLLNSMFVLHCKQISQYKSVAVVRKKPLAETQTSSVNMM